MVNWASLMKSRIEKRAEESGRKLKFRLKKEREMLNVSKKEKVDVFSLNFVNEKTEELSPSLEKAMKESRKKMEKLSSLGNRTTKAPKTMSKTRGMLSSRRLDTEESRNPPKRAKLNIMYSTARTQDVFKRLQSSRSFKFYQSRTNFKSQKPKKKKSKRKFRIGKIDKKSCYLAKDGFRSDRKSKYSVRKDRRSKYGGSGRKDLISVKSLDQRYLIDTLKQLKSKYKEI